MTKIFKGVAVLIFAALLTGCTINVGTDSSGKMSPDEQDFLACELWIEGIGGFSESNPGTLTSQPEDDEIKKQNISVLSGYIERLRDVDSTLALQVKRILENMREYNTIHLETGEYPFDLSISQMDLVGPASEKCDELVGWEYELEAPVN
jgi:hypothetical protein